MAADEKPGSSFIDHPFVRGVLIVVVAAIIIGLGAVTLKAYQALPREDARKIYIEKTQFEEFAEGQEKILDDIATIKTDIAVIKVRLGIAREEATDPPDQ